MLEGITLATTCATLLIGSLFGVPIIYPLAAGLLILLIYAFGKTRDLRKVLRMTTIGFKTTSAVILMLCLIGMMGATWRASGAIPYLIYHVLDFCNPAFALTASFVICAIASVIMGSAIGTASTMGIVCITICLDVGIDPAIAGGSILAGCYFGDRWSLVSTSSLVVAKTTGTNRYDNLMRMVKPTILPLAITVAIFLMLGTATEGGFDIEASQKALHQGFAFTPWLLTPIAAIIILSLFRIRFQITLISSILCSLALMFAVQGYNAENLPELLLFGFHPVEGFSGQVAGGGILSMTYIMGIIAISSCYMGLLSETGMIHAIQRGLGRLSDKSTRFISVTVSSVATNMMACNQTMAIMLVSQLYKDDGESAEELALIEEDTTVPIAALIPWSTACIAPLEIIGAPTASVAFACFLYLLPLLGAAKSLIKRKQGNGTVAANGINGKNAS